MKETRTIVDPEKTVIIGAWERLRTEYNTTCHTGKERNDLPAFEKWIHNHLSTLPQNKQASCKLVQEALKEYHERPYPYPYVVCFSIWLNYIRRRKLKHKRYPH